MKKNIALIWILGVKSSFCNNRHTNLLWKVHYCIENKQKSYTDGESYRLFDNDSKTNIVIYVAYWILCGQILWLQPFHFWCFWHIFYFMNVSFRDKDVFHFNVSWNSNVNTCIGRGVVGSMLSYRQCIFQISSVVVLVLARIIFLLVAG